MNTIVIIRRRAERQVDVTQCLVCAHLSQSGDGMEYPELLAGANVETSHVTGWHLRGKWNVIDPMTTTSRQMTGGEDTPYRWRSLGINPKR